VEDFGLSAAESLTCGTPVIAYSAGGALEIVKDGVNGVLFNKQSEESLVEAINRFQKIKFEEPTITESAQKFSEALFRQNLTRVINQSLTLPL
jgi:glycosyltransferase involved in cell wall biosynthesis